MLVFSFVCIEKFVKTARLASPSVCSALVLELQTVYNLS